MRTGLLIFLLLAGGVPAAAQETGGAPPAAAFSAELEIEELGSDAGLRIRVFHDPGFFPVPETAGRLFLVAADSARGTDPAFFIPTDLAFELGDEEVYRVEFEQASDLFGQALGGRLRFGERQIGFILVPNAVDFERFLPGSPERVQVRYAHHRTALRPATAEESAWWAHTVDRNLLAAGLNRWWEWMQAVAQAPEMNEGDKRFFAERVFPGQGHVMNDEGVSHEALRNAILRVGERKLLHSNVTQRVYPNYPAAAQQMGAGGLVVVLAYITPDGTVGDALILASNTVHLLNLAALRAAQQFRFARVKDTEAPADGWRLLPFQFRPTGTPQADAPSMAPEGNYEPARMVKRVEPEYSFEARRLKLEGTVVYLVNLDERGKLTRTVLEQSVHPVLDQAALAALEKSLFLPATRNGQPVPSELRVPYTFTYVP